MIGNELLEGYIASLGSDIPEFLDRLEQWALSENVPIIRKDMQFLLKFLLLKNKPEKILEIGTAVGFSTLFTEYYAPKTSNITTIEKVEMRLVHARKNLAGHDRIELIEGDASAVLKKLKEEDRKFDFIFLDAAKGQYPSYLPDIRALLPVGGLLITDNVLLEGSIAQSKFSIERRDRTIHTRMRQYLYELTHSSDLETVVLNVGDGVSLSYRINDK